MPWILKGTVVIAYNCDYGCPCNFNARPTYGKCEGQWTWQIREGSFGSVRLDQLIFSVCVKWPGAIHEGNGEALILIDERADNLQREAIMTLIGGKFGGPWQILAWTWPKVHGPKPVRYVVEQNGIYSRVQAGNSLLVESTTIKNAVTGAEVHPGIVLPEGIIVKQGDLGSSKVFRVSDEIEMDYSGKYTAVGSFDYSGPLPNPAS